LSKALVASSNIKILFFLAKHLAITILYLSPPLNLLPLIPTSLENYLYLEFIKSKA